jgi:tetratricopeptide (TPR) repeat protein
MAETLERARFDEAIALVNAGDTAGAEALCRGALARDPRDVNMLALLGAVLAKMRRFEEAEQALRRAMALAPTFAKPCEDLGHVLLETGKPQEAVRALRKAVRLDPASDSAWFTLGKALAAAGEGKEADAAFERAFELSPEKRAMAHAARLHKAGRLEEAEKRYRAVLRDYPGNVDAMRLLAGIAARTHRPAEAERLLREAVRRAPDFAGAWTDLGLLLREQDRFEEAIEALRTAIAVEPHNARVHFLLGGTLAPAALTYDAISEYRRAIEIRPDHAGAWLGLGHTLKTVGRTDEAVEAYRRCARLRPDNGEIWWSLANLKTYRFTDAEIEYMEEKLRGGNLRPISEVNFLFALAKAHEDRGDYDTAWEYYRRGNARRREQEWYDPAQTEVLFSGIREVFTPELIARSAGSGCEDPAPIFIVGLPRSGSTLIEQILASHTDVEGTAELPYIGRLVTALSRNRADGINYPHAVRELGPEHFRSMGEEYLRMARLHRVEGRPRFIDKMPNNFPHAGFISLILPNAKIIDARRHPLDACVGCFRQLFARGQPFTYDLADLGEYYLQYLGMMEHWDAVLPGRVHRVQYEELVADPEREIRRLLEFCGLPWQDACLRFHETERPVRTASSAQVRQPLNADAIGRWKRYEKYLGELIEILGEDARA